MGFRHFGQVISLNSGVKFESTVFLELLKWSILILSDTQKGIFDAVLKGHLDLESDPWPKISDSAKDLIRRMLCNCPSERLKAHEVLRKYIFSISSPLQIVLVVTNTFLLYLFTNYMLIPGHPWICQNGVASDGVLDPSVISRLKRFSAMNNLQKLALRVSSLQFFPFHIFGSLQV